MEDLRHASLFVETVVPLFLCSKNVCVTNLGLLLHEENYSFFNEKIYCKAHWKAICVETVTAVRLFCYEKWAGLDGALVSSQGLTWTQETWLDLLWRYKGLLLGSCWLISISGSSVPPGLSTLITVKLIAEKIQIRVHNMIFSQITVFWNVWCAKKILLV